MMRWLQMFAAPSVLAGTVEVTPSAPAPVETSAVPASDSSPPPHRYRAIFISDTPLGPRGCKAVYLLDFLRHSESEYLYLVGDIIDGWALTKNFHWPQPHNDIVQKVLRKARKGTRVVYVPGNPDEAGRQFAGSGSRKSGSSECWRAMSWRACTARPMSSCSRAGPTRSGW